MRDVDGNGAEISWGADAANGRYEIRCDCNYTQDADTLHEAGMLAAQHDRCFHPRLGETEE
jgi:hypothetical protein